MWQTFIKVVNYQHMMPTRYTLDVDLKSIVTTDAVETVSKRKEARLVRWTGLCHKMMWKLCPFECAGIV